MEDETSSDLQKCLSDGQMDTDEGPLINENSNGLSHLLTEGEFNSVDAAVVDESSTSNQGFLNAVELSGGSVGDYLENNTNSFNADNFDVGDNAVTFPSDSLNVLSDGDSRLSESAYKTVVSDIETDASESQKAKMDVDEEIDKGDDYSNLQKIDEDSNIIHKIDDDSNITNENELLQNTELAQTELSNAAAKSEGKEVVEEILDSNDQFDTDPENGAKIVKKTNSTHHENDVVEKDNKGGGAEETENVSEDELPTVEKPSVKDAENVSDDELPGPKPADLPADTEVVSEDELPSSKKESRKRKTSGEKEGYDPHSPTSEENANKKVALSKNGESKPISAEKRPSTDEKKPLPELDKYWKVVNDDPTDFTGWTYLLQYVDQENDVEAAREAYDAFLSHYPYCYGYWRKYADYEKRKGSKKKCLEVLERGLKAIPLSVDLWIHYLNHIKTTRTEDLAFIRSQYERAIDTCGLEFRSDRLWESYIKWESENGNALNVTKIYDRLLATPTLGYTSHFDNFQEHIMSEPVVSAVETAELVRLRGEVRAAGDSAPQLDLPPGEDEPPTHLASEEEGQAIKERIIAARRKIHKTTGEEVAARWTFEEGIKRPYFHVKPLERCQLKNWKSYLEWEKQHGSFKRALVLHERCLIACALYEEFWMRLIKFLEERSAADPDLIAIEREVLERACTVHHLDKPELHLHWAHFEEAQGNADKAAEILDRIEKNCPSLVRIQYRRVNLERRRGDYDKVCQLYEGYIAAAKSKPIASALAIKYARFLFHIKKDHAAARAVLDEAISKEPLNHRLHSQRLDLAIHTPGIEFEQLEELCQSYEKQECADAEVCASMAWRRQELAEELGGAAAARAAALHAQAAARALRKRNRKEKHDAPPPPAITQPPSDNTTVANKRKDVTENTQIDPSKPKRRRVRPLIRVRKRKAPRQTQQPPQITTERPATTSSNTRRPTPRPPGGTSSPPHPTSTTRPRPGHSTLTTTRSRPRHSTLTATRLRPGHSTQTTTRLPTDYGNPITIRSRPGQINPNTTRPRPDHSNPTSTRPRPDHSNPTSTRPRPDHSNPTSTRPRSGHSTTTRLRPGHINTTTIRSRPSHSIQTSTRPRPGYSTQTTTRTLFTRRPLPAWM